MLVISNAMARIAFGRIASAVMVASIGFGLAGCGSDADRTRLTVVGSSTIAPALGEIAKAFEQQHPGVRVDVQAGGTARAVTDVRQGSADIGMVSRRLNPDETDLERVLIARDGLSLIVHSTNPVARLAKDQVVAIYDGTVTNWNQLGGADLPITVVSKAEGRSTLEIFSEYFDIGYRDIRAQVVIGDNQQGIQSVATTPGAIAYVSIGTAEYESRHGATIRLVPIDGHVPSTTAIASGTYPIIRELNLVFKAPYSSQTGAFLEFVRSSEAAALISEQFFVPATQ